MKKNEMRGKLQEALAKVSALRKDSAETMARIQATKAEMRAKTEEHIGKIRRKAEQGDPGAEIAYQNLLRSRKLME